MSGFARTCKRNVAQDLPQLLCLSEYQMKESVGRGPLHSVVERVRQEARLVRRVAAAQPPAVKRASSAHNVQIVRRPVYVDEAHEAKPHFPQWVASIVDGGGGL